MLSQRHIGLLCVFMAATGYAFLPIITRTIYANSDLIPTDIALWRFIIATPAFWLGIIFSESLNKKSPKSRDSLAQIFKMLSLGLFYAGAALSAFFGLQYISASLYVVLFYTYPAYVALIALLLGQRLRLVAWVALALTLIGVLLTVPDLRLAGENTLLGISIAFFGALIVAIYFTLVAPVMKQAASITHGSAWIISGTFLVLLLAIPFFGLHTPSNTITWVLLLALAIISTVLPIFLINLAIHIIGATQASIVSTAEPILTMMLALILLGEVILPIQWLGAAFIIGGVLILELVPQRKITQELMNN